MVYNIGSRRSSAAGDDIDHHHAAPLTIDDDSTNNNSPHSYYRYVYPPHLLVWKVSASGISLPVFTPTSNLKYPTEGDTSDGSLTITIHKAKKLHHNGTFDCFIECKFGR